eukprot:m.153078 g.153078  ORF g.153078 m.153078 type:complete len:226 (+) comp30828_c0_seq1:249-926(+)
MLFLLISILCGVHSAASQSGCRFYVNSSYSPDVNDVSKLESAASEYVKEATSSTVSVKVESLRGMLLFRFTPDKVQDCNQGSSLANKINKERIPLTFVDSQSAHHALIVFPCSLTRTTAVDTVGTFYDQNVNLTTHSCIVREDQTLHSTSVATGKDLDIVTIIGLSAGTVVIMIIVGVLVLRLVGNEGKIFKKKTEPAWNVNDDEFERQGGAFMVENSMMLNSEL